MIGRLADAPAWTRRTPRERALVGALALSALSYGLVVGVAQPLLAMRAEARVAIARSDAALARLGMLPSPGEGGAAPAVPVSAGPVPAVLTETAPEFGLAIQRIEPEAEGARLVLEDAEFARVLGWIEALERIHGLRLDALEMQRRPEPGVVSARLTVGR